MRYELRRLETGWAIWDTEANTPAIVNGRWQTGLGIDNAEFLLGCLNRQDRAGKARQEPA